MGPVTWVRTPPSTRSNISDDRKSYSDREFAVILSKASELARASEGAERSPMASGFSLEEMKTIAAEVGLDPLLVERAARLTPVDASESRFDRILGGPVKYRFGGHFETKLTDETAAHLLAVVRAAAEQQGEGEASASGVSWHSVGEGTQLLLSAHAEGEGTRVTIVADRRSSLAIHATFSAMGALAVGIAILVGGEVAEVQSLSLGLAMIGGGAASVFALGRAVWRSTARGVRERALALMETVGRSLEDSGLEPTPDEGAAGQAQ